MSVNVSGGDGSLHFEASLDSQNFEDSLKKIEADLQSLTTTSNRGFQQAEGNVSKITSTLLTAGASLVATQKLYEFLGDSIKEALDAEASTARFKNTLEGINRADVFDHLMEAADNLAAKFTHLDNDEIVSVFNKLISYGKLTQKQIEDLLPVIINFSAKQRISLEEGSSIIIKALEGNSRSLKEYGISLKSSATETERFNAIMTILKGKVEGAGEAFLKTTAGGIASTRQEFKDISEDIGTTLLPSLNKLLDFVNKSVKGLKFLGNDIKDIFTLKPIGTTNDKLKEEDLKKQASAEGIETEIKVLTKKYQDAISKGVISSEEVVKRLKERLSKGTDNLFNQKITQGVLANFDKSVLGGGGTDDTKVKKSNAEVNKLLEERKSILKSIADLERGSEQSGLTKDQKEIDVVKEKYDKLILKIQEYNDKAQRLKKPTISLDDLNTAKRNEVENTLLKQDAEKYKESLNEQKQIFSNYEEAKKQIGINAANELFKGQTKGFESYQSFLQSEYQKTFAKIALGFGNSGDLLKFKSLSTELTNTSKNQVQKQIEDFGKLMASTNDYYSEKSKLDAFYNNQFEVLEKNKTLITTDEYNRRKEALKANQEDELNALQSSFARQTDLYKKLGEDLLLQTRSDLKNRVEELNKILSQGFTIDSKTGVKKILTPEMIAAIKGAVDQIKQLLNNTNETAISAEETATKFGKVRNAISAATELAAQFDEGLASALQTMSSLVSAAEDITSSVASFSTGDIIGGIGSAISGITKVVGSLFGTSPEEKRRQQEIKNLQDSVYKGEFAINELYRQRELAQVRINDLRLKGAEAELEVLKNQKTEIEKETADVLTKLQQQTFTGTTEELYKFIADNNLGFFDKMRVLADRQLPLANKTFDELEKLNAFGQLSGTAKDLFDTLSKLKQEGVDVDQAIKDLNNQLKIDLTGGATKDNIADSIAQGFEQGKRSAADFADTFQDLMKKAALAALKIRFLDEPLKKFIDQFQADVVSGDQLTSQEIGDLKKVYDSIIANANTQFSQLQQISGLDFNAGLTNQQNSLSGAIKGMTEQSAELLAGQFGGLRITALDQLNVARQGLVVMQNIEANTGATVFELKKQTDTLINFYRTEGVKIK